MSHFFIRLAAATGLAAVHVLSNAQDVAALAARAAGSSALGAVPCCQQLKRHVRLPLPLEKTELTLDEKSAAHDFGQGTQALLLLELPAYKNTYVVNITSLPGGSGSSNRSELTHVAMRIETLDADFSPLRVYPHTGMKKRGHGYEKTIFINPSNQNERYLLIYGALDVEPERVTVSTTDVVFVGTGFFLGGIDNAITLRATGSGVLQVETKGLQPEK